MRTHDPSDQAGLTLIELAIVLVVVGLILGMTLPLLSELSKHRHYRSTQKDMEEIREALVGYAYMKGRLPWADSDGDGRENSGQTVGSLPFLDLGLGAVDAWRKPYRYDVNDRLTGTSSLQGLCAALSQIGANEDPRLAFSPGGTGSPQALVVLSGGENSALDGENGDPDRQYEALPQSNTYDDLVVWISPNTLAGKLNCSGSGGGGGCVTYQVLNRRGNQISVIGGAYQACTGVPQNRYFTVAQGEAVNVYNNPQCQGNYDTVNYFQAQAADGDGDCLVQWRIGGLGDE